jgi:peptidylglycine monooxygenase
MGYRNVISSFCALIHIITVPVFGGNEGAYELRMPGVQPQTHDVYLCHAVKLNNNKDSFITGFKPHGSMMTAHHMLLYGCLLPGTEQDVWNCGEMAPESGSGSQEFQAGPVCSSGSQIVYAWAKDAPELKLPKDVGFKVGGESSIQYLVLQVHYMHQLPEPDYSGITLQYTTEIMPKQAGVLLMVTGGKIDKKANEKFETACLIDEDVELHPFAYRTHTHKNGKVVSGYLVRDGQWSLIGKKDPQLPQMFYPVDNTNMIIKNGDTVAARCTMHNENDRDVFIGSTGGDEMCNFYMMYWVNGDKTLADSTCYSPGPPYYYWDRDGGLTNIPKDASTL